MAFYTNPTVVLEGGGRVSLLYLRSVQSGAGKSTVAVGLAAALQRSGISVRLERGVSGSNALDDSRTFSQIPGVRSTGRPIDGPASISDSDLTIIEEAGSNEESYLRPDMDSATVIICRYSELNSSMVTDLIESSNAIGLIVTSVPVKFTADAITSRARGLLVPLLGWIPQDRLLAAPLISEMAAAVAGDLTGLPSLHEEAVEWLQIGPISAHEGIDHFSRYPDQVVVTRNDKADVALAALDAGAVCLILTGGTPPLPYLAERAESEDFSLIVTEVTTPEAVNRIGALYGRSAFRGSRKRERARLLLEPRVDLMALRQLFA